MKTPKIDYQTQWTHPGLGEANFLYFQANTPIEEIVQQTQEALNQKYPELKVDYKKSRDRFLRLYRNLLTEFKGWTVRYKRPYIEEAYQPISEKIGYKSKPRNPANAKKFNRPMRWTHQLYPAVGVVETSPFFTVTQIARLLNQQIERSRWDGLLLEWSPLLERVNQNYAEIKTTSLFNKSNEAKWCHFFNDFDSLHKKLQQFNDHAPQKNSRITASNIHNLLSQDLKTIKGWRVEFLD